MRTYAHAVRKWFCSSPFLILQLSQLFHQIETQSGGVSVLHILGVDHSLSGEIKCSVYSREFPKIFNVYHTSLTVLPVPNSEKYESIEKLLDTSNSSSILNDLPAYFIKGPADCTVLIGASITLEVTYVGVPEPKVKWLRAVSFYFYIFIEQV